MPTEPNIDLTIDAPVKPDLDDRRFSSDRIIRSALLFTIVGVLLYCLATLATDYKSISAAILNFPPLTLALVIALVLSGWILRGWRFHYYLVKSGYSVNLWYSISVFLSGFALTGTPGKIGEAVKGVFLKEDYGTPLTKVMGIVMIERLMDLWGVLLLASCSLLLFRSYQAIFLLCALAVVGGGAILCMENLYRPILQLTAKIGFLRWISEKVLSILLTGRDLMKPRIFAVGLISSAVAWGTESFSLYLIMTGLSLDVSVLQANFVYSFSTLIGALSMLPGGIGGTEAGMIGLMRFLGINYSAGLPAVILIRLCTLWMAIFIGMIFILALLARSKRKASGTPNR
jgi:glycosyltransferase 2 family protein